MNPWDWAAGRLLVPEAGGAVGDPEEAPFRLVAPAPQLLVELPGLVAT